MGGFQELEKEGSGFSSECPEESLAMLTPGILPSETCIELLTPRIARYSVCGRLFQQQWGAVEPAALPLVLRAVDGKAACCEDWRAQLPLCSHCSLLAPQVPARRPWGAGAVARDSHFWLGITNLNLERHREVDYSGPTWDVELAGVEG